MDKLLVICGPTATGKTNIASMIAGKIPSELVSADSRQVYRFMDIGTGKDLPENARVLPDRVKVPYGSGTRTLQPYSFGPSKIWLYDAVFPDEPFSADDYVRMARPVIRHIWRRGRLPIVVGGTGLYIKMLLQGSDTRIPPDNALRRKLENASVVTLQEILRSESPEVWARLNASDRWNPRRLVRKIEIVRAGRTKEARLPGLRADVLSVGLTAASSVLYPRIDVRVRERVGKGLIKEIDALLKKGYSFSLHSFSSLGYREWEPWFDGSAPRTEKEKQAILAKWQFHEHAYARRQMTWFRKIPSILWFDVGREGYEKNIEEAVTAWYTRK